MNAAAPAVAVRHALVVGTAEPLARPLAMALARAGATVSVAALTADRDEVTAAHSILNECWSLGRDGQAVELAAAESFAAALAELEAAAGPLDLAIAFAPAGLAVLSVAATLMRGRAGGRVVVVGGAGGNVGGDGAAALAAAAAWAAALPPSTVAVSLVNAAGTTPERVVAMVLTPPPGGR